ncbi:MAG: hypothetical protein U1E28_14150 [Beijerinckiaceae bacterium]|mgnify:CR=1 FL=1
MKLLKPALVCSAFLFAAPVFAQGVGGGVSGLGGAKEQMYPSTVGADPRPDRETMRARRPAFQSIQARHGYWRHRHYVRHRMFH